MLAMAEKPRFRHDLTPRELDVLRLIARGLPNKLIARRLGISRRTVEVHLAEIYRAMHVQNRTEAAVKARDSENVSTDISRLHE
jgi:DNA-binding NarL/FixJ family response regulator